MKDKVADKFFNDIDYVSIVSTIKGIFTSDGSMNTLLDFERVIDEADLYAYKNWLVGELVQGPTLGRYNCKCIFMYPDKLMPDPRGARRLLPFDCTVKYRKTTITIPIRIMNPSDYRPGTKKAKMVEKKIWLVEISMPKALMSDIRTGSIELEDQEIDLGDLDQAYEQDLDKEANQSEEAADAAQQSLQQQPGTVPGQTPGVPGAPA